MQETDKDMPYNIEIYENFSVVTYNKNITVHTGKKSNKYELILHFFAHRADIYLNLPYFDLSFIIKDDKKVLLDISFIGSDSIIIDLKNQKLSRSDIEGIICSIKYDGLLSEKLINTKINYDIVIQHLTQMLSKIKIKQLRLIKSRVMGV